MQVVSGRRFSGEEVRVDNNSYSNCVFEDCRLIYSGGEVPDFRGCQFAGNTHLAFLESASRTLDYLGRFAQSNLSGLSHPILMAINGKNPDGTDIVRYDLNTQSLVQIKFHSFEQNLEEQLADSSAAMYTVFFDLWIDGVITNNLSVKIKQTVGSSDPDDLEVYNIEGYNWSLPYIQFQNAARNYCQYARSVGGNPPPGSNVVMENNFFGGFEKMYRFVENKTTET